VPICFTITAILTGTSSVFEEHFGKIVCELYHDKDSEGVSAGNYHVKLTLEHQIPEFLPIQGTKARVFNQGMTKQRTKCFKIGYYQKFCKNNHAGLSRKALGHLNLSKQPIPPPKIAKTILS